LACSRQAAGTGSISGTVNDYLGNPVEAQILGAPEGFEGGISALTETDGTYSITDVPVGTWSMRCTFEGMIKPVDLAIQFAEGVTVSSGLTTTVDFTLPIGGKLAGRVTNTEGDRIANATVWVRDDVEDRYWFGTNTDSNGDYNFFDNFGNMPPGIGIYEIEVGPPLGTPCVGRIVTGISVFENQTTIVDIPLTCFGPGQIPSTWVGGQSGNWGDASNWNPPIVPDNNESLKFVVIIDSNAIGVDEIEVYLQQDHTIDQLDCYGTLELVNWVVNPIRLTLNDPNGLANYGALHIGGDGTVWIVGNVTNTARAGLEFWDVEIVGNLYNSADAIMEFGPHIEIQDGDFQNAGLLAISPECTELQVDMNFYNSGKIRIDGSVFNVGEVFDNNTTAAIEGFGIIFADDLLRNKGTIYASSGSLLLRSDISMTNRGTFKNNVGATLHIEGGDIEVPIADVNNRGIIEVNADGSVVFDCNLINEPNGTINLYGGTLAATTITQTADANFAGFGGITGDVSIDPNGLIQLTGPTNIVGDVMIDPNATLEISDGTTLITGHTTCNNGTIHMIGGRVICQGGLTNNSCNIIWEPGTYINVADFNLDGTVNFKDFAYIADSWLWQASWY
jgi:hypothetical protein